MESEIWKSVVNHPHYEVSNFGNVKTKKGNGMLLKPSVNEKGYLYVRCDGKHKKIARIVAEAFIENPENKPEIDHIDRVKTNNHFSNLRWATRTEQLANRAERKMPKSGHRHIVARENGHYTVEINNSKERHYVGYYKSLEEAIKARDEYLASDK